jgi:hypothetical protein
LLPGRRERYRFADRVRCRSEGHPSSSVLFSMAQYRLRDNLNGR